MRQTGAMEYDELGPEEFAQLDGLEDWRYLLGEITATFRAGSFGAAAALVTAVAAAADEAEHHPDIELRYPDRVRVTLTTHAVGDLTTADADLARQVSAIAAELDATSEPVAAQAIEFAIDTKHADLIRPFWAAVLGYVEQEDYLVDPLRVGPPLWFQEMDEERPQRNRFHIDVTVPHDVAEQRIDAALAAGGTLVTDDYARSWWVLADADGNEACVCTWQDR